ncbi:cytochrome P450 [Micromonospora sp. NPDC093277]|uniref:cytochrome P450 n=1 Tax=Micromonospora sp. NPDC093277 TaxID=3364291 RepID=UPI0038186CF1
MPTSENAPAAPAPIPPPGPKGWSVVGDLPAIWRQGMVPFFERCWRQHGDVFRFDAGQNAVVVAHPEGIKRILATRRDNYVKGRSFDGLRRVLGDGLITLEGEQWRARRTIVQPAFHRTALGGITDAMVESGRRYFDGLRDRLDPGGWSSIDAYREMVSLTLDVVVTALFGRDLGPAAEVSGDGFGKALELVSERTNGIVLPEWLPTPRNLRFHRTLRQLDAAVYRVIDAGRRRGADAERTLLAMLLSARDEDTGAPLSDREIRDEVFTLFVAGHETTALTLTWLFTLLDGRPEVLAAMRAEVDDVLEGRDPDYSDVPRLGYLRKVVDETLRLRGPVVMTARTALADDEILGFSIKRDDLVMPYFWGAHRHRRFWSDPERFDPERFDPDRGKDRHPWSYLPFSGGQRMCIGATFSLVESVVLLAQLLNRFELRTVPGQDIGFNMLTTLRPASPVRIELRPRGTS